MKPYRCPECGAGFDRRPNGMDALIEHIETEHPDSDLSLSTDA
jgi:hypothetical protein